MDWIIPTVFFGFVGLALVVIQSDYPTQEQLAEAGYKLESMTFPSETTCRLQWMFYGKEEKDDDAEDRPQHPDLPFMLLVLLRAEQRRTVRKLGEDGSRRDTESSAQVRDRLVRWMEEEEVAMRDMHDLMDKVLSVVFIVCGAIALITLTSAFVFFLVETMIAVATNGINGV